MSYPKNTKNWTWKHMEAYRNKEKFPLPVVCEELGISLVEYREFVQMSEHPTKTASVILQKYKHFMRVERLNYGAECMLYLNKLLDHRGISKTAFYQSIGMRYGSIAQQIRNDINVPMEQVAKAYGQMGLKIVFVDVAGVKRKEIITKEFLRQENKDSDEAS